MPQRVLLVENMKVVSTIFSMLFLLLLVSDSFAQVASIEQEVIQLFDRPDKVIWVKHYKGRVDDLNDVSLTLGYDGKHCKGQLKYLKSKEVFGLAGFIKNKKIRLKEINGSQKVSGFIEGEMTGKTIVAEWSKQDNSVAGSLVLKETKKPSSRPTHCGHNKWLKTFNGTVARNDVEMTLQLGAEGELRGIAYFYKHDKTFQVKGMHQDNSKVELDIYDANSFVIGSVRGRLSEKGIIEAGYVGTDGKQEMCSFWKQKELPIACNEYADYYGSYDVTYPKFNNKAVNQRISSTAAKWMDDCRKKSKKIKDVHKGLDPERRATVRAYGWCDLDYIAPKVISGTMMMRNTWETKPKMEAFNFDLETNKEIKMEDLFDKDFDYQKFVWGYISEDIKKHKYYDDYGFRKWLGNVLFEAFTIRKDGINFSTSYNSIYGQYSVTVPYYELKTYFKKKSPIWKLIEK